MPSHATSTLTMLALTIKNRVRTVTPPGCIVVMFITLAWTSTCGRRFLFRVSRLLLERHGAQRLRQIEQALCRRAHEHRRRHVGETPRFDRSRCHRERATVDAANHAESRAHRNARRLDDKVWQV